MIRLLMPEQSVVDETKRFPGVVWISPSPILTNRDVKPEEITNLTSETAVETTVVIREGKLR